MDTQPQTPSASRPPLSHVELMDLRGRVLRGEPVSDEELNHALATLAQARMHSTAGAESARAIGNAKSTASVKLSSSGTSVADRLAAFRNKAQPQSQSQQEVPPATDAGQ